VYIDDWTTEATRSLWYAIQEENPRIFPKILWTDHPTLFREIPHSLVCDKCQQLICQLCVACINPLCENAHQIDCLSESKIYPLGSLLFDFTDRKLVVRLGDYELPIPPDELRRFYIWLDIRKDWC
jgi:hypothetical protein